MARPTVITPEVQAELTLYLSQGANNTEACRLANISEDSFYTRVKNDKEFADKMELARNETVLQAKKVVKQAINEGDKQMASWYLERKAKAEFAQRTELTGSEGTPLGYVYSSDIKQIETDQPKQLPETTNP